MAPRDGQRASEVARQVASRQREPGALGFPDGFLWGVATSPTQVEGGTDNEWTGVKARDGSDCSVACDHWNRHDEDLGWMQQLSVNAYRFGIEWSRLQTKPYGELETKPLDRYLSWLQSLKDRRIEPMLVLHHFTNPRWVFEKGGWVNRETVDAFCDYVSKLLRHAAPLVRLWNTFNEPDTYGNLTYLTGQFPPFRWGHPLRLYRALRHMAQAHRRAYRLIHDHPRICQRAEVGITKNYTFFEPLRRWHPIDRIPAALCRHFYNAAVLDAFYEKRGHPYSDFIGLNFYGRIRFRRFTVLAPLGGADRKALAAQGILCDDMVEKVPEYLTKIACELHGTYRLPIYVTECGAATSDEEFRTRDLRSHLRALHAAIAAGADVRGYFHWSLMDNFEWNFGYAKKFGLIGVDFMDPALPRRMKKTGEVYRGICETNAVTE